MDILLAAAGKTVNQADPAFKLLVEFCRTPLIIGLADGVRAM